MIPSFFFLYLSPLSLLNLMYQILQPEIVGITIANSQSSMTF